LGGIKELCNTLIYRFWEEYKRKFGLRSSNEFVYISPRNCSTLFI